MTLPDAFLGAPLAHRAFHAKVRGRPENSRAAIEAAIEAGYGIEIDVQLSRDNIAMVFHDYELSRLTAEKGPIRQRSAKELANIPLKGGDETIPTLSEVLDLVAGRVPVLIEIKDQDGVMGPNVGALEGSVARALTDYDGPVAVMSFNPHSMAEMASLAPDVPRGLATCSFSQEDWPILPQVTRTLLARIPDLERVGACFISHDVKDLAAPRVAEIKDAGLPVLCWTVKSKRMETQAREIADNVTFEGYAAKLPA